MGPGRPAGRRDRDLPPDEVPSSPPTSYSRATLNYMDSDGALVNTATPAGAGIGAPSISTSEYDEFGNVVRELTPQNRARSLAAGSGSAKLSEEIDTKRKYSKDGTELQEEWGPLHQVRLQNRAKQNRPGSTRFTYTTKVGRALA